jgi:hypothetical protein
MALKPKRTAPYRAQPSEHHFQCSSPKSPYLSYAPRGAVSDHFDGSAQTQALRISMERNENDFEAWIYHTYRVYISLNLGK